MAWCASARAAICRHRAFETTYSDQRTASTWRSLPTGDSIFKRCARPWGRDRSRSDPAARRQCRARQSRRGTRCRHRRLGRRALCSRAARMLDEAQVAERQEFTSIADIASDPPAHQAREHDLRSSRVKDGTPLKLLARTQAIDTPAISTGSGRKLGAQYQGRLRAHGYGVDAIAELPSKEGDMKAGAAAAPRRPVVPRGAAPRTIHPAASSARSVRFRRTAGTATGDPARAAISCTGRALRERVRAAPTALPEPGLPGWTAPAAPRPGRVTAAGRLAAYRVGALAPLDACAPCCRHSVQTIRQAPTALAQRQVGAAGPVDAGHPIERFFFFFCLFFSFFFFERARTRMS